MDVAVDVVARAISWVFDLSMLIVWLRGGAALNGAVRHSARTAARTRSLIQRLLCWLRWGIYFVDPLRLDSLGQTDLFAAQRSMDDDLRWMVIFCRIALLLLVIGFAVLVWTGELSFP